MLQFAPCLDINIRRPSSGYHDLSSIFYQHEQPVHYLCNMLARSKKAYESLDIVQTQCQTNNAVIRSLNETRNKSRLSHSWHRVGV